MKFAFQIKNGGEIFIPGIYRRNTKREAQKVADQVNAHNGKAVVMRRKSDADKWQEI